MEKNNKKTSQHGLKRHAKSNGIDDQLLKTISEDKWLLHITDFFNTAGWIGHAPFLKFLIREIEPKVYVELGVHYGFSYFTACQSIKELNLSTKTYAVDTWQGDDHAGSLDNEVFDKVSSVNETYEDFSTLLKMRFNEALDHVEDNTIDLLHIDGFHTYEAVKEDFESWLPKMSDNSVIIMHDIHVRFGTFGVHRYWDEIKSKYPTIEFTHGWGLGVVFIGDTNSDVLNIFKDLTDSDLMKVQGLFANLADRVYHHYNNMVSWGLFHYKHWRNLYPY
jgi:predicted O-methyltransferase YrrM